MIFQSLPKITLSMSLAVVHINNDSYNDASAIEEMSSKE